MKLLLKKYRHLKALFNTDSLTRKSQLEKLLLIFGNRQTKTIFKRNLKKINLKSLKKSRLTFSS